MGGDCVLTFDVGTTGLKCSLFDSAWTEVAAAAESYATRYPRPGWAEQEAPDYWRAAVSACGRALDAPGVDRARIAAIGLSGHMNGCLPVDASGEPLHPEIIHSDGRSAAQCRAILERIGQEEFYAITGNRVDAHFSLPKMLWLRDERPELYSRTAFFLNSKDYLRSRLVGATGLSDFSDASLTCCLDLARRVWSSSLASELGLDASKLPELRAGDEIAGILCPKAAAELGLPTGIPVSVGGGDAACATRGAMVRDSREAYIYLGSSSWTSMLAERPLFDPAMRVQNFYDLDGERCNVCGTAQNASIAVDWALSLVEADFDWLEEASRAAPPCSGGLLFLPYLMGERTPHWDAEARGAFVGLSLSADRAQLLRSVLEGVAFALGDLIEVYRDLGRPVERLILMGGGARSPLWRRILCDALGLPLRLHRSPVGATSLGAALAAGRGVGLAREGAAAFADEERPLLPEAGAVASYARMRSIFDAAYRALKPIYGELAALARERDEENIA